VAGAPASAPAAASRQLSLKILVFIVSPLVSRSWTGAEGPDEIEVVDLAVGKGLYGGRR
jgi:hypothetical protein